ncbi:hypothetical protein [Pseudomaricurvus sp. HS19]|uniref:hypothetical protein n=1 Tax=Pseudomaricurvus sp. HS19 TaxID=2692626 RepID=UPI0013710A7A|nr:hypothetical protein [Pseudomaricurvus sp. HS19]MYM64846.1 hypothetical protein [Pseudomaricurvus sp. HS19]
MMKRIQSQVSTLAVLSLFAVQSFAGSTLPPRSLPFGDGALFAVGAACVVGVVWLLRSKKK